MAINLIEIKNKALIDSALAYHGIENNNRINLLLIEQSGDKATALFGIGKFPGASDREFEIIKCWLDYKLVHTDILSSLIQHLAATRIIVFMPLADFEFKKIAVQFKKLGITKYKGKTYRRYDWKYNGH